MKLSGLKKQLSIYEKTGVAMIIQNAINGLDISDEEELNFEILEQVRQEIYSWLKKPENKRKRLAYSILDGFNSSEMALQYIEKKQHIFLNH